MPSFTSPDGLAIHYRVLGAGEPMVLLHGWMMSGAVWDPITGALLTAGKQLIIPDQRGAGLSDKPVDGYTLDRYAADVVALADTAGLERFILIGHSMGGQIAQLAAAALGDRVTSLELICPVPLSGITLPDPLVALFRNSGGDPAAQTQILQMACKQLDPSKLAFLLGCAASVSPECVAQAFDAWTAGAGVDRLAEITATTRVFGTDDPFLPPALLQQAVVAPIANSTFVYVPGPGHYPQVENPNAITTALRHTVP